MYNRLLYSTSIQINDIYHEKLSTRIDIVNRGLLRSVKKFYLEEFKKDNRKIVKKRFRQVRAQDILEGFRKTCHRLFGDLPNLDLIAQFLKIFWGIKHKSEFAYDESIKSKGDLVVKVMHKYSHSLIEKIFQIEELKFIVKHLVENHKERIFTFTRHLKTLDHNSYSKVLDLWMLKFEGKFCQKFKNK